MGGLIPLFVTSTKRLPKKLRNTINLKNYILSRAPSLLEEDWKKFINWLKGEKDLVEYYEKYKDKNFEEILKFNIVITRGKINSNNVGCLYGKRLPKEFYDLFNEEVDLRKVNLPSEKKVRIKEFVLDASIEILFYGINNFELTNIKNLEQKLKSELNITNIFEYLKMSEDDISKIFREKFSEDKAKEYANLLQTRCKKYKEALSELKININ